MSKSKSKVKDNVDDINDIYFTSSSKSKPKITKLGVYDLAGDNVEGVYDLSNSQRDSEHPEGGEPKTISDRLQEWKAGFDPDDWKEWILIHRQTILIVVVIIVCLIIGIGIPLSLLLGNQKQHNTLEKSTEKPGKLGLSRIFFYCFLFILEKISKP